MSIDESQSIQILEAEKANLEHEYFLPLGFGAEWVVYIPDKAPLPESIEHSRQVFYAIDDVYDDAYRSTQRALNQQLVVRMEELHPNVVFKVSRVCVEAEVYIYSEEELHKMFEERKANYELMKQYYGDYVSDCIFWVGELPKELPPRSYWEPAPGVRKTIRDVEDLATHKQALMCVSQYVKGTSLYMWLKSHEVNPRIQDVLDITIRMLQQEGKIVDITSFSRDNIIIDEEGYPHIIDPTYIIDKDSDRMKNILAGLGRTSYLDIQQEDLLDR